MVVNGEEIHTIGRDYNITMEDNEKMRIKEIEQTKCFTQTRKYKYTTLYPKNFTIMNKNLEKHRTTDTERGRFDRIIKTIEELNKTELKDHKILKPRETIMEFHHKSRHPIGNITLVMAKKFGLSFKRGTV